MRRIVFVTGTMERGGAQRVLSLLANAYCEKGWQVTLVMLLRDELHYPLNEKVQIVSICRKRSYKRNIRYWICSLRKLIRNIDPAVVVSFVGRINLLTSAAMMGTDIPLLMSERNDPAHDRRNKLEKYLCRRCYQNAKLVVFQTKYQQDFYGEKCRNHSRIIKNPIAAPIYEGAHISEDIISVGKLMPQKNHRMLIDAFVYIADRYPDKKVHIYGEGKQRDMLQSYIDALGMTDRIILEGNKESIFEEMQKYRYFVMTSNYEGLSNALAEAMTSGMDCITTAWNGVEELIVEGETGYIVPVEDTKTLGQRLDDLFSGHLHGCGKQAQTAAKAFQADNILLQWFAAIESIAKEI